MSVKLISLIDKARPRRALFTTFTFSISWFEAIIVPALRCWGCEQIDVLVDARYARRSTDEASGLYIGSAYRVIPVYMAKTTVFHPKLVYLEGHDDADRLVVSSANLTLSGHGKNLEVLDAISAASEPGVLADFADFLDGLTAKYEFSADCAEILGGYGARIRARLVKPGPVGDSRRRAWLVHTLSRPAGEQLTEHAYRLDNPHTLTVLSPFHSPTGSPVQELADEIGVGKIRIGLDGKNPVAPFLKDGNAFDAVPGFLRADLDHFDRTLHAKCFEVQGDDGVIVMTGSVNATAQSLASTDNVEVSLVRLLDETPFAWKKLDKPKEYKACQFNVDELTARNPALQVSLTPDNRLVGQVFPAGDDQRVTLRVLDGDTSRHLQQNVPITNGAFDVRLNRMLKADNALQLIVTGDDLYAVGWINVELDLRTAPSQRELAKASARLLAGEHRNADLDQITNWLLSLQSRLKPTGTPGGPRPSGAGPKTKAPPAHKMTYAEWRKSIEEAQGSNGQSTLSRNAIEAAIQWVNRDVKRRKDIPDLKAPEPKKPGGPTEGQPDVPSKPMLPGGPVPKRTKPRFIASEDEEFSQQPGTPQDNDEAKETDERFLQALEAIPRGLELDARGSIVPLLVELSATQVLKLTLNTLGPVEDSGRQTSQLPLIQGWLNRFARFGYSEQNREALLPLFAAMACCAAEFHGDVVLPTLKEALVRIGAWDCGVFVDAFCGTGAVAEIAASLGWPTRLNDNLLSSATMAAARLTSKLEATFLALGGYENAIATLNTVAPAKGFIWREYSPASAKLCGIERRYFTEDNASCIDGVRAKIAEWQTQGKLTATEERLLIADLLGAVNRCANIAGTYGCFLSKWTAQAKTAFALQARKMKDSTGSVEVRVGDVSGIPVGPDDVVYLDPPYTKRQYAAYYHLLETVAAGDEPIVEGVSGLRPWKDRASDFCYKVRALNALTNLVANLPARKVLLSYSNEGHISIADLEPALKAMGKVSIIALQDIGRYRPNQQASASASEVKEYLIVIEKAKKAAAGKNRNAREEEEALA